VAKSRECDIAATSALKQESSAWTAARQYPICVEVISAKSAISETGLRGGVEMQQDTEILTYTGKWFAPMEPRVNDVDIVDIAHALSLICRFTGHTKYHYSVAQHSIAVSCLCDPKTMIYGLMHDAAEAYLTDIAHPIKAGFMWNGKPFSEVEDHLMEVILNALGVPQPSTAARKEVTAIDRSVGVSESIQLMKHQLSWGRNTRVEPANYRVHPWMAEYAEQCFMKKFNDLKSHNWEGM
jgi:hypothetical protein